MKKKRRREKREEKKKEKGIFSGTQFSVLSPRGARSRGRLLSSLDGESRTMKPLHVHQHTLQRSVCTLYA